MPTLYHHLTSSCSSVTWEVSCGARDSSSWDKEDGKKLFFVVISLTDLQLSFFSRQTTQIFNDCYVRFFLHSLVCAKCKIIYPGNTRNPTADLHEFHCAWYIIIIIILMFLTGGVKGAKLLEFVSRSIVFRHSVYISSSWGSDCKLPGFQLYISRSILEPLQWWRDCRGSYGAVH